MGLKARLDERPLSGAQIRIVVLMMVLLMFEGLDIQLLGLLAPVILKDWGIDRAAFGPAMAAALVGLSIGAGIGGRLGDAFGRKSVLMVSAAIFSLATAAAGFAGDVTQMTAIRFIGGLGFGAASPVTITLVAEWLPRRAQPIAISLMSVGVPLGGMVGSLLLIPLIALLGWRGCFIAFGGLTALLALIVYALLPESAAWLIARGQIARGLALLRRHVDSALGEADIKREADAVAPADARGKGAGAIFVHPLRRLTVGSWLLFFSGQFIAYSLISWSTTFLTLAGFTMAEALQGNFAFNVCAVIATLGAGLLIGWFGSRRVLLFATLLSLVSLIALTGALLGAPGPATFWLVMIAIAGVGLFDSMAIATGYAVMTMGYPEKVRSTGLGITLMIGRSGGMVTGLIGGWLLSLSGDQAWPMLLLLVALSLVTLTAGFVIDRHIGVRRARAG
jgi:AAHS family 4-hydroxybenzoate transporter-like MFS transporter